MWKGGRLVCLIATHPAHVLNVSKGDFDEIDDESHSESDEEELCDSSLSDDE